MDMYIAAHCIPTYHNNVPKTNVHTIGAKYVEFESEKQCDILCGVELYIYLKYCMGRSTR